MKHLLGFLKRHVVFIGSALKALGTVGGWVGNVFAFKTLFIELSKNMTGTWTAVPPVVAGVMSLLFDALQRMRGKDVTAATKKVETIAEVLKDRVKHLDERVEDTVDEAIDFSPINPGIEKLLGAYVSSPGAIGSLEVVDVGFTALSFFGPLLGILLLLIVYGGYGAEDFENAGMLLQSALAAVGASTAGVGAAGRALALSEADEAVLRQHFLAWRKLFKYYEQLPQNIAIEGVNKEALVEYRNSFFSSSTDKNKLISKSELEERVDDILQGIKALASRGGGDLETSHLLSSGCK